MEILNVKNLRKTYVKGFIPKKQLVLKGVSFSLQPGTITGFLGGNGAGKTTTMKCLLGLAFPDSGEVEYFGQKELTSQIKAKIGFLPERPYFYEYLTGMEFLKFYGQISTKLKKHDLNQRILSLLERVDLIHAKDKALRDYSKGMLQKIGLAQALVHRPEFVILDEPMAGLDPDGRYYLSELIKETASEGTAVFLSSHLLHDVEQLCEHLVVLTGGNVVYEGLTQKFLESMNPSIDISYVDSGVGKTCSVPKGEALQLKIRELLKSNFDIMEIKENKISLEEAFVNTALRKDS